MGQVAPEVTAKAIWLTQYSCRTACGRVGYFKRRCHDGSGQCTPWEIVHCDC